ncbi:MAG: OmpA family protein [Cyanobacteriota bacterium]
MKKFILLFLLFVSFSFNSFAEDVSGSKDYPMFTRMPNFEIIEYSNNFAGVEFQITEEKTLTKEGNKFFIKYNINSENAKLPSTLQIIRNYQNAVKKLGGKTIYNKNNIVTFKIDKGNKETWIMLNDFYQPTENETSAYNLVIIEVEAMKQEVAANEIFDSLNKDGFISLYINFDTGKSNIKTESKPIIDEIVKMLNDNPDVKISIEGHTDNVGTAQSNKTLSASRAKEVMNYLISKGISSSKLSSTGWGQENPIADNRSEEGRAKNRRVEIVKK